MRRILLAATSLAIVATPASAHHPMGGAMPETMLQGVMSGVGHPIIGPDHLAFIIAAGILAGMIGRPILAPLALVAGALLGAVIHLGAVSIPGAEALVAVSVILAGTAVFLGRRLGAGAVVSAFAVAGIFHGYAYAEAVIGAEKGVIGAYLAAFSLTQWAITSGAGFAASLLLSTSAWHRTRRIAGSALTMVGVVFLAQAVI
jgi:urease accessory protein